MTTTTDDYCIKPGYRARDRALTIEAEAGSYWNAERIATAALYQHDVYELAADCAARMGADLRIADVGCGYPQKLLRLQPNAASLTCFDQPTLAAVVARDFPSLRFCPVDLERPAQPAERFDLVICADVIEHLLDPDPCLHLLRDLLTERGILVLSTPERDLVRGPGCMSSDKPEHVREWNRDEFARFVTRGALRIVDHLLVPPARLTPFERAEIAARGERGTRRTEGCQVTVCVRA